MCGVATMGFGSFMLLLPQKMNDTKSKIPEDTVKLIRAEQDKGMNKVFQVLLGDFNEIGGTSRDRYPAKTYRVLTRL